MRDAEYFEKCSRDPAHEIRHRILRLAFFLIQRTFHKTSESTNSAVIIPSGARDACPNTASEKMEKELSAKQ